MDGLEGGGIKGRYEILLDFEFDSGDLFASSNSPGSLIYFPVPSTSFASLFAEVIKSNLQQTINHHAFVKSSYPLPPLSHNRFSPPLRIIPSSNPHRNLTRCHKIHNRTEKSHNTQRLPRRPPRLPPRNRRFINRRYGSPHSIRKSPCSLNRGTNDLQ